MKRKLAVTGAIVAVLAVAGGGGAMAFGGGQGDSTLTGPTADAAKSRHPSGLLRA